MKIVMNKPGCVNTKLDCILIFKLYFIIFKFFNFLSPRLNLPRNNRFSETLYMFKLKMVNQNNYLFPQIELPFFNVFYINTFSINIDINNSFNFHSFYIDFEEILKFTKAISS